MEFSKEFIKSIKARDEKAFEELYNKTKSVLLNFIRYKVRGNDAIAEDILSEVYHDAVVYAMTLSTGHNVLAWLYRIAGSKIVDHFRKAKREKRLVGIQKWIVSDRELLNRFADTTAAHLVAEEDNHIFQVGFSRLPQGLREVLALKYIDGKSVNEIALLKGKSEKAIESLLFRARGQLEKELKKGAGEKIYFFGKGGETDVCAKVE
jgi:RNA polymerase sigma-70 factor (ECF subfamily)